jgi:hypothetical protein
VYDRNGRIVFTAAKVYLALVSPAPSGNKSNNATWHGRAQSDGLRYPGGPRERTIVYEAPFDRCDREQDYEIVGGVRAEVGRKGSVDLQPAMRA